MLDDFNLNCRGIDEEEFCEKILQYSLRHSIWIPNTTKTWQVDAFDRLIHLTAIQNTYDLFKSPYIINQNATKTEIAEEQLESIYQCFDKQINNHEKLNQYIRNLLKNPNKTTDLS